MREPFPHAFKDMYSGKGQSQASSRRCGTVHAVHAVASSENRHRIAHLDEGHRHQVVMYGQRNDSGARWQVLRPQHQLLPVEPVGHSLHSGFRWSPHCLCLTSH